MKWYVKASVHNVLSIIPSGKTINRLLQERCGELRHPEVSLDDIKDTFVTPIIARYGSLKDVRILEIGSGWLPVLPVALALTGARCLTFDVRKHLSRRLLLRALRIVSDQQTLLPVEPRFQTANLIRDHENMTLETILEAIGLTYGAPVDTSRLPVPADTQDVTLSRLVLQHIPPKLVTSVLKEQYRVLKPGGISIHRVNLHDEYASIDPSVTLINFLRYPAWFWERFGNNALKYVNRARYPFYVDQFEKVGFRVLQLSTKIDRRSLDALPRIRIDNEFRDYSAEQLATVGCTLLLEKL